MIRIINGNLGSGKTVSVVRDMMLDRSKLVTYSNIRTKLRNAMFIRPEHVITKQKFMDGKKEKIKLKLNIGYWMKRKKPLNIIWDEIHLTASSRRSMSSVNQVFSQFVAMARRFTGMDETGYGTVTFIAQTERTIDLNIKELANDIQYNRMHWLLTCRNCYKSLPVTSDDPMRRKCVFCSSQDIYRNRFNLEIWKFKNFSRYFRFIDDGMRGKHHYEHFFVNDIAEYFRNYDTHQIESLWEDYLFEQ